jgi:hypothetical protein
MIITADNFLTDKHGSDCEWLSRQAIIDVMEQYAQKFYAAKVQQIIVPNDTYVEKRTKFPKNPPIQDLP